MICQRKLKFLIKFLTVFGLIGYLYADKYFQHKEKCLNGMWDFIAEERLSEPGKSLKPPSKKWNKIIVPSWWNEFSQYKDVLRAWYKRKFAVPKKWRKKRVVVRFERIVERCYVFVNNKFCGSSDIGHVPFEVDITKAVKFGKENILLVLVDATPLLLTEKFSKERCAEIFKNKEYNNWRKIEYPRLVRPQGRYGIGDDVWLFSVPGVYIKWVEVRETSIRTRKLKLGIIFKNTTKSRKRGSLQIDVYDKGKIIYSKITKRFNIPVGEKKIKLSFDWIAPELWSPWNPYLYELEVKLKTSKYEDNFRLKFGFREFWIKDKNFYLNGKVIRLWGIQGIGRHYPPRVREIMRYVKFMGARVYRNQYNFDPSYVLDICDEEGMLVIQGSPVDHGVLDYTKPELKKSYKEYAKRFVSAYISHPSIIMWEINNEVCCGYTGPRKGVNEFFIWAEELFHKLDPSRPVIQDGNADWGVKTDVISTHYMDSVAMVESWVLSNSSKPFCNSEWSLRRYAYYPSYTKPWMARVGGEKVYSRGFCVRANMEKEIDLIECWRELGISYIGLFGRFSDPWDYAIYTERAKQYIYYKYPTLEGDGFKPKPVEFAKTKENIIVLNPNNKPIRYPSTHFPSYYHAFNHWLIFIKTPMRGVISGEKVKYEVVVVNDDWYTSDEKEVTCSIEWELYKDTHIYRYGVKYIKVAYSKSNSCFIEFEVPEVEERVPANLIVRLQPRGWGYYYHEGYLNFDQKKLEILPKEYMKAPKIKKRILLYDSLGETAKLLSKMGLSFTRIKNPAILSAKSISHIFVIGYRSFDEKINRSFSNILNLVKKGMVAIIFEQVFDIPILNFKLAKNSQERIFPTVDYHHPLLRNLEYWDFAEIRKGYLPIDHPFIKPGKGTYRIILECGNKLKEAAVIEYFLGKGLIIFCQANVTPLYFREPFMTKLFHNILEYADKYRYYCNKIVAADKFSKKVCNSLGIPHHRYGKIIFVSYRSKKDLSKVKSVLKKLKREKKIIFLNIDTDDVDKLGIDLIRPKREKKFVACKSLDFHHLVNGLSNSDLCREGAKIGMYQLKDGDPPLANFVLKRNKFWESIIEPVMLERNFGKGKIIVTTLSFSEENLKSQIGQRVICNIFTNLLFTKWWE